jgi:nucleotide-binding universal stress UspA family protein
MKIKRLLVPVDFSDSSAKLLRFAIDFARMHEAEMLLVHVIEPMNYAVPRWLPEPTTLLEEQRKEAAAKITRLTERARAGRVKCTGEVHFGVVYEAIADLARRSGADMIVIATHGRTGLAHMIIGSVAERVIHNATCPVLVIRTLKLRRDPRRQRAKAVARARRQ